MTDLEITKACADAIGLAFPEDGDSVLIDVGSVLPGGYDPLHDDAQAMALVKKFGLGIYREGDEWGCYKFRPTGPHPDVSNSDLNRAICECVAKMQKAKS